MRGLKKSTFIFFLFISSFCFGQSQTSSISNIETGTIPGLDVFKHLTKSEKELDSIMQTDHIEMLNSLLKDDAFIKGTSKGLIDSAIEQEKILSELPYQYNRSRFSFQNFKNGKQIAKTNNEVELDSTGIACSCFLNNDTLKVVMGIWVFGGFFFPIDIVENRARSNYYIDDHDRKVFKLNNSDTLSDNILVPIVSQKLIFDSLPTYKVGQQLYGYLTFKTERFLQANDLEDGLIKTDYSEKNMDIMYTQGVIWFTCEVRQKLLQDE